MKPPMDATRAVRVGSATVIALFGVMLAGCGGGNAAGSFVGRASNAAVFVQWTRSGSQLTGSVHQALISQEGSASVETSTLAMTGTVSGSSVTLTLTEGLGAKENITGTLNGGTLELDYPGAHEGIVQLELTPANSSAYNQAVTALRGEAEHANTAAAQAKQSSEEAQRRVQQVEARAQQIEGDAKAVAADLGSLDSAVKEAAGSEGSGLYASDLQQENKDLSQAEQDTQATASARGGSEPGTVCSDAGTVQSDVGSIESDVGSIESDQGTASSATSTLGDVLSELQKDRVSLRIDRQSDPADVPARAPGEATIETAVKAADGAIAAVKAASDQAHAQAIGLLTQAKAYEKQASASCSAGQ